MNETLRKILEDLEIASVTIQNSVPGEVGAGAGIAALLIRIAQAANNAYIAQVGQPMDLNLLQDVTPLPNTLPQS